MRDSGLVVSAAPWLAPPPALSVATGLEQGQGGTDTLFTAAGGLFLSALADKGQILGSTTRATGSSPPNVTLSGTPAAPVGLIITITVAGALGVAKFTVSDDNGATVYGPFFTASTFNLPGVRASGLVANFPAGTYAIGHVYTPTFNEWRDQSGAGITSLTTQSPSFSPSFVVASNIGGKPAYRFDSTIVNLFRFAQPTALVSWGPYTMAALVRGTTTNYGVHTLVGWNNAGDVSQNQMYNYSNFGSHKVARGNPAVESSRNAPTYPWLDDQTHVLVWTFDGTHAGNRVLLDNVDVSTAWTTVSGSDPGAAPDSWNYASLGGTAGGSFRFDGDVRAFQMWNRALTAAELLRVQSVLSTY